MSQRAFSRALRRLLSAPAAAGGDPDRLPTLDEEHNGRMLRGEAPASGLAFGSAPGFFALYAMQLGASNALVGWLTAGPALIQLAWLLPCGALVQRARSYALVLNASVLLQRLGLLCLAGVPFLPALWRPGALVVLVTLLALPLALWSVAWQATAGDLFRPAHFTRLVGQIWAVSNLAQVLFMLGLGALVDSLRFPLNFQALYVGIGLVSLLSVVFILRLRFPPHEPAPARPIARRPSLGAPIRAAGQQRSFALFQIGVFVGYAGFFGAAPLSRIYWVRELGAAGGWVGALTAAFLLGATLGNLFWGRRAYGPNSRRLCLIVMCGSMAGYPLLTAVFHSLAPLVAVGVLVGFFDGGIGLTLLNRVMQLASADQRPTFVAVYSLTVNLAAFLAPLAATALADLLSVRAVLALLGIVGMAGAALVFSLGWGPAAAASTA